MSPHDLQAKVYKKEQGSAVGFIKFTDYLDNLKDGQIYLGRIIDFDNGEPPISDPFEGYLLDSKPITSYKDILRFYSSNCESYISCFTTLFESDFDVEGNIKESTVERLKKLDSNNAKDKPARSAVIFPIKILDIFNRLVAANRIFQKWKAYGIYNCPNSLYKNDYNALKKAFSNYNLQTIKASYVNYLDEGYKVELSKDDKHHLKEYAELIKDKIKAKELSQKLLECYLSLYDYYLNCCFFEKYKVLESYHYDIQREYRLMYTFFEDNKSEDNKSKELPKNLTLNFNLDPQYSKVITNENLGNIKRSFFNTESILKSNDDCLDCVSL